MVREPLLKKVFVDITIISLFFGNTVATQTNRQHEGVEANGGAVFRLYRISQEYTRHNVCSH